MREPYVSAQLVFQGLGSRAVVAGFDGGTITSDAGALLLRVVETTRGIISRFAACFTDLRDERYVEHSVPSMVAQRVYGLCLGYEDVIDHDQLREANGGECKGAREELERIVAHIPRCWPQVRILVRADSGFSTDELMSWCEANEVDYVFGMARNK